MEACFFWGGGVDFSALGLIVGHNVELLGSGICSRRKAALHLHLSCAAECTVVLSSFFAKHVNSKTCYPGNIGKCKEVDKSCVAGSS